MPTPALTSEFRKIVRNALDATGISCSSGYTDKPKRCSRVAELGDIRYVAMPLSYGWRDTALLREAVHSMNVELDRLGYSTCAESTGGYIRGRCVASK